MYGDISFELVGTVVADRELSTLANGQDRASINVAVNTPRKNRDTGEYEEVTTWVRVAVFGDRAKSASVDACRKGMPVYMRGTIQSYSQEISGKNYTMYNFRPDVLRPLLTPDQLGTMRSMTREQPPEGFRETGRREPDRRALPPPLRDAPPSRAAVREPPAPPPPEDVDADAAGYFDDDPT